MLTVLSILAVLAVLFVAAAVATREGPILADAPADVADLGLPDGPLQPEDLQAVRFGLAIRGYRMSEVDAVLDRVAKELADRDRQLAGMTKPDPASVAVPVATSVVAAKAEPKDAEPEPDPEPAEAKVKTDAAPVVPIEPPLDAPPPPIETVEPSKAEEPDEEVSDAAVAAEGPEAVEVEPEKPETVPDEVESDTEDKTVALITATPEVDDAEDDVPSEPEPPAAPETSSDDRPAVTSEGSDTPEPIEPPEPPPVEVAVVPTEVAPLPPEVTTGDEDRKPQD